jgi:hypothetical protein
VGWSDDYPATYYEQYLDVTGLRGRFAYAMVVDPDDHLQEINEENNRSATLVTLPPRNGRVYPKPLPEPFVIPPRR